MSVQELLGWGTSIIASLGLSEFPKALIIIVIATGAIMRFAGRKE